MAPALLKPSVRHSVSLYLLPTLSIMKGFIEEEILCIADMYSSPSMVLEPLRHERVSLSKYSDRVHTLASG